MRIFYIYRLINHFNGAERIIVDKANCLVKMFGYDVYMITVDQGNHPINYPVDNNVHIVDLNIRTHSPYDFKQGWKRWKEKWRVSRLFTCKLHELIDQVSPDVIICLSDTLTNWVIESHRNVPLIVESHTIFKKNLHWGNGKTPLTGLFYRWFTLINIRRADVVVPLTKSDANYWKYVNNNVEVITNVVRLNPLGRFSDCLPKHVIFVSRISYQKGIPYLLKIWESVYDRHPDWHLDIFGENECDEYYDRLLSKSACNVRVYEPTVNIYEHYVNSSISILTSLFEPFGLVLPEAMSCGLPVVSFDSDYGPREIITDGVDGFLIPLFDVELFVDRICKLIESPELRLRMGRAGIQSSKRYAPEVVMPKWKDLFERLTDKTD